MSLINDALRKAQKQRTGEMPVLSSMPAIGGESAARIAKRTRPAGFYTLLIRLGAGVALLAVVIIGGVMLLRKKTGPVETATPPVQTAAVPQATAVQTPAPQPPAATPQPAATTFVVPVVVQPTPAATPKASTPIVPAETPKPVASVATPVTAKPEPVKPAVPGKLDSKAIQFIESLKVVGIRASTTDSKVLMNDRVYRIGNIVEHEMGIKLTGITANSLTFEDERGGSYTRTF